MLKDKYDFIQEILNNQNLSQNQREKILGLTAKEIKKEKELGNVLGERISRLEELVGVNEEIKTPSKKGSKKFNNPSLPKKYYYPSGLYKFLLGYNQDPILKSTCHLIDSNELEKINAYCKTKLYNYEKHYSKILQSYMKLEKMFAPTYIKSLIRGYLSGKDFNGNEVLGWSKDKIALYWCHQTLKDWCYRNPGVPPNLDEGLSEKLENVGFEFETPIKIQEVYLQSLADLVIHFKKMFHIREDNSLYKILHNENTYRNWEEKIDFQIDISYFPENIEFFTDIDKLLQSYNEILILINQFKRNEKPIVKLSLTEGEDSIFLSIHHLNGIFGKSLPSSKSRLIGQQYAAIINKLNGVCNMYLQADFGQKVRSRLTVWDDVWNIQKERIDDDSDAAFQGGVEHILEFKRS